MRASINGGQPLRRVYRMQNKLGQGPFHGSSMSWLDDPEHLSPSQSLGSVTDDFGYGILLELYADLLEHGGYFACGVSALSKIDLWFSATEQKRLALIGFFVAAFSDVTVLYENDNQLVFWRKSPLSDGYEPIIQVSESSAISA